MKQMHMQRGHRLVHLSILKLSQAFFLFFQPDKSKKTMHETRSTVMSNYQIREYSEFIPWMILLNKSQQVWQMQQQRQSCWGWCTERWAHGAGAAQGHISPGDALGLLLCGGKSRQHFSHPCYSSLYSLKSMYYLHNHWK